MQKIRIKITLKKKRSNQQFYQPNFAKELQQRKKELSSNVSGAVSVQQDAKL